MPDLSFRIGSPTPRAYSASPMIAAPLHIANACPDEPVQSILLNCQVRIEPLGRSYTAAEEARLLDLFGERERWARTMKPLLWTIQVVKVPAFSSEHAVDLLLPCTMDFDVAATKYFYGLEAGAIHANAQFSGTVFYSDPTGFLQATQIPWDREARFQISVDVWRQAIEAHYPDAAWLRLPKNTFDKLYRFKVAHGVPTWDAVIEQLLDRASPSDNNQSMQTTAGV